MRISTTDAKRGEKWLRKRRGAGGSPENSRSRRQSASSNSPRTSGRITSLPCMSCVRFTEHKPEGIGRESGQHEARHDGAPHDGEADWQLQGSTNSEACYLSDDGTQVVLQQDSRQAA